MSSLQSVENCVGCRFPIFQLDLLPFVSLGPPDHSLEPDSLVTSLGGCTRPRCSRPPSLRATFAPSSLLLAAAARHGAPCIGLNSIVESEEIRKLAPRYDPVEGMK